MAKYAKLCLMLNVNILYRKRMFYIEQIKEIRIINLYFPVFPTLVKISSISRDGKYRCYIVPFPPSHLSPRKNGYIAVFPPGKMAIQQFFPQGKLTIQWAFPLFIARLPPRKTYYIVDFPPFLHSGHVYGGSFVTIICNN